MYLHCIYTLPDLLSTPCSNIFQEKFPLPQGCSKVGSVHSKPETRRPKAELIATPAEQPPIESGHSRNSELPPITGMGADNTAGRQAGRLRHGLFPICDYLRHLRLRNSDFGLLSGFGLRSSDFRAAEHDLPSTGRTLEPPCLFPPRDPDSAPLKATSKPPKPI